MCQISREKALRNTRMAAKAWRTSLRFDQILTITSRSWVTRDRILAGRQVSANHSRRTFMVKNWEMSLVL